MTNKLNKGGFTLIELLVVVLIIGILSSIALPQYTKAVEKSRAAEAQSWLADFVQGEAIYKMANGDYTATVDDLDVTLPTTLKNFGTPSVVKSGTATAPIITATLTRQNSSMPYALEVVMTHSQTTGADTIQRYCKTNQKACLSISNGATCAASPKGAGTDKPWCYNG